MTFLKLKPEVKTLWLEALRSGDYRQGREALHSQAGFCCLGVLCNVYKDKAGDDTMDWTASHSGEMAFGHYEDDNVAYPPKEVYEWAFENCNDAEANTVRLPQAVYRNPQEWTGLDEDEAQSLVDCNDTLELDFNRIADIIEEQL